MGRDLSILKRKLTNLSSANPILWMGKPRAGIHLDMADVLMMSGINAEDFQNELCSGKKKIRLSATFDPRSPSENKSGIAFHRLAKARLMENQERGTDNLFVAWPFVYGQWPDGSWLRTPFQFIPVHLENDGKFWWILPQIESAILNPAFMLAYAHHTGKSLDTNLFEKELAIQAENAIEYLTRLYEILRDSGLDINFNSDLFTLRLESFLTVRKSDNPVGFGPGIIKLQAQAMLGIFSLSDSLLLPDFEWLSNHQIDLESLFLKNPPELVQPKEKDLLFPLPVDGSQEDCLREVLSGKNLLVQGPPGTGKSQLITNLVASSVANGKSVLVVCQKKVALEVVQRRLNEIGIGRHAALWADFRNDLSRLYSELANHIEHLEETETRNKGLDTVMLEREYLRQSQEITRISDQLDGWKSALFDESHAGISCYALRERTSTKKAQFLLPVFAEFRYSEWEEFLRWADRHEKMLFSGRPSGSILARRSVWSSEQTDLILGELEMIAEKETDFRQFMMETGWTESGFPNQLLENSCGFLAPLQVLAPMKVETVLSEEFFHTLQLKLSKLELLFSFLEYWPEELSFTASELQELVSLQRQKAESNRVFHQVVSIFQSKWKPYFNACRLLKTKGYSDPDLAILKASEFLGMRDEHILFQDISLDQGGKQEAVRILNEIPREVHNLRFQADFYREVGVLLNTRNIKSLADLSELANELKIRWQERKQHLSRISGLFPAIAEEECLIALQSEIRQWKDIANHIRDSDLLLESLPSHWQNCLFLWLGTGKSISLSELDAAWAFAWITQLENHFPLLRYSEDYFEREISALQDSILKKRQLAGDFLRLRLEEETHRNVVRNRLQNRVTYRGLYHQVSKKRQRLPLRKLWELHGEEILRFIPCWLATPESVSATWSMEMKFDLVVFDEASQCFAEKGIPSIARGKQIVIIGDAKQLPPNHLFSSRWEENYEEGDEVLFSEQDSLLDLGGQFYPTRMLRGHYRSSFPELIEFSNRHFYDAKLQVFPAPEALKKRPSAVQFIKVDGIWQNQCNPVEANWIAEQAVRFFRENTGETLGIISFNVRQQEQIEEAVIVRSVSESVLIPDWFFVKNIENVQGDERDYIWFSVAYARNEEGKMISQFGSLGTDGGENRLNVAISRAKKGILLVCSLLPGDWEFARNFSKGPQLLAEYLRFVYSNCISDLIPDDQALGSLLLVADELEGNPENRNNLVFRNQSRLYSHKSMKSHFGLLPIFLKELGYKISFRYWQQG